MSLSPRLLAYVLAILGLPALGVALALSVARTDDTAHAAPAAALQPVPPEVTVEVPIMIIPPAETTTATETATRPPASGSTREARQPTAAERAARVTFTPDEVARAWQGKEHERAVMAEDGTLVPESYYAQKVTKANKPASTSSKATETRQPPSSSSTTAPTTTRTSKPAEATTAPTSTAGTTSKATTTTSSASTTTTAPSTTTTTSAPTTTSASG